MAVDQQVPPAFVHPESSKPDKARRLMIVWGLFAAIVSFLFVLAGYAADWITGTMYLTVFFFCFIPSIYFVACALQMTKIILATDHEWSHILKGVFSFGERRPYNQTQKMADQNFNIDPYAPGSAAWSEYGPGAEEQQPKEYKHL